MMTILLLLTCGVLPVAAQTYQVVETIAQVTDEAIMECCAMAGQSNMNLQETSECQAATGAPRSCFCHVPVPQTPVGLLTASPPLPLAEDTLMAPSWLTHWTEFIPFNARVQFKLPPKTKPINLRQTCLRI